MIEVKHLCKRYGEHVAVDDLSFTIENGHVYGFLGPNGAGKSTTMNILTGCLAATSGTVSIDGFDIFEDAAEAKSRIGYLPEIPPLYQDMTVREYLTFVAKAKGVGRKTQTSVATLETAEAADGAASEATIPLVPTDKRTARGAARASRAELKAALHTQLAAAMAVTQIEDVADRLIKNLSKGYKQRVGIAQALLGGPEIIILDEPTVGLDPKQIIEIRDLIRALGKEHTVILSSHILSEVRSICDRLLIIAGGKLVADDTPEHLEQRYAPMTFEEIFLELTGEMSEEQAQAIADGIIPAFASEPEPARAIAGDALLPQGEQAEAGAARDANAESRKDNEAGAAIDADAESREDNEAGNRHQTCRHESADADAENREDNEDNGNRKEVRSDESDL